jgi:hypothetical protein
MYQNNMDNREEYLLCSCSSGLALLNVNKVSVAVAKECIMGSCSSGLALLNVN